MPSATETNPARLEDMPDILTVPETAHVLRLGVNHVYELCRQGEIPNVLRWGRTIRIPKAAIGRMLEVGHE